MRSLRSTSSRFTESSRFTRSPSGLTRALRLLLPALAALRPAADALADRRLFVWTYEAQTLERGEAEIESYTTFSAADRSHTRNATAASLQLELEAGMTNRLDFAIYQVFAQAPGEPMKYEGYKLRFRHRLNSAGRLPFASVGYLEYKGRPDFSTSAVEAKLILGRDLGPVRLAGNAILELEPEGDEWEVEPEYAVAGAWMPSDLLSLGLEAKGSENGHSIGPVLGHGLGDLWMSLGSALLLGSGDGHEAEVEARLLLGIKVR